MFPKIIHSLTARVIFLSTVGGLVLLIAIGLSSVWLFEESLEDQLDNHIMAYVDVLAGAIRIENGKVVLSKNASILQSIPRYWQVDAEEYHVAKSNILKSWIPIRKPLSLEPYHFQISQESGPELIVIQRGFIFPGKHWVIITFCLEEQVALAYKADLKKQFDASLFKTISFVAVILVLIILAQVVLINRPLKQINLALGQVRSGQRGRIEGKFPKEIQMLSDELNNLLDYISNVVDRHRTLSSNLAHAIKTPLTVIRNETKSSNIHNQIDSILQVIDRNLARAQTAGKSKSLNPQSKIHPILKRIVGSFERVYQKKIKIQCSESTTINFDEIDLYEILGNLIENACKYGNSNVLVTVKSNLIMVEDDGVGIPLNERESVLNRGIRLDQSKPGVGIGLSVVKEILNLYRAKIELMDSELGGLKVIIELRRE